MLSIAIQPLKVPIIWDPAASITYASSILTNAIMMIPDGKDDRKPACMHAVHSLARHKLPVTGGNGALASYVLAGRRFTGASMSPDWAFIPGAV